MQDKDRLKNVRENLGLTQEQFGEKLGRPQSYISALEAGRKSITYDFLKELVNVFEVNPAYIMIGWPQMYLKKNATNASYQVNEDQEKAIYKKQEKIEDELAQLLEVDEDLAEYKRRLTKHLIRLKKRK